MAGAVEIIEPVGIGLFAAARGVGHRGAQSVAYRGRQFRLGRSDQDARRLDAVDDDSLIGKRARGKKGNRRYRSQKEPFEHQAQIVHHAAPSHPRIRPPVRRIFVRAMIKFYRLCRVPQARCRGRDLQSPGVAAFRQHVVLPWLPARIP